MSYRKLNGSMNANLTWERVVHGMMIIRVRGLVSRRARNFSLTDCLDSAYIFAGGLPRDLTEGDVVTIFSQYGEIMNINMPRDKETGKPKGFAFLMYEDQRSTILAVDNLNGANILERTIRVDHVKNYKEKRIKNQDGEWVDPEEQSLNAKPEIIISALSGFHLSVFCPRPLTLL